ncbi:hypothetical protein ACN27F_34240 [Solwaraspora sp. WMMB335]|uniref:hypothetical protein n=1 Tax=Solwaraspora sp. WMMB335 TaxID=3404118 RepID=UPI003B96672D
MASSQRLLDVIEYVEEDPRVQVVFTVAPDVFNRGVAEYLESLGALLLPWQQAINHHFDLAVTASYGGLHQVHAPLVVMAHGAGHGKAVRPPERCGPLSREAAVYGLDAQRLTRDGRVLAAAVVLCHDDELDTLRRQCPEAVPAALVAGDPCYDRLVASLPLRRQYRRAFGIDDRMQLVVVGSTWGPGGLFGRLPDLLSIVMEQLPADRFRVAALLHPAVWGAHGHRQIRAWLRGCLQAGLVLPDPAQDWRALVVAADYVIGDNGSVTTYAAALGRPVLVDQSASVTVPGSPQHTVLTSAARLRPDLPVLPQLRQAPPIDYHAVRSALTSRPDAAASLLRRRMYELLQLAEPGRHRSASAVEVPRLTRPPIDPQGAR